MKGEGTTLSTAQYLEDNVKSELKLTSALKNGSTEALEKIISDYSSYVCTVIRNFSRGRLSREDIDESAADVFIRLWQHRDRLDAECELKPYISAIARNIVKNRFRLVSPLSEDIDEIEAVSDFDLEQTVERSELMRCLNQGLMQVSKEDREIFLRFYFYGEKTSEIGRKLNLNSSTVRSKLTRTRSKLKDYLTERGFDHV